MFFLFLLSLLIYKAYPSSPLETTTFSFPRFGPDACLNGELMCMGSVSSGEGYLNITPQPDGNLSQPINQVGRVLYAKPVPAWPAMISTSFTIRISGNSNVSGDGMAFLFAEDNSPSPPDSYGSYMGILGRSASVRQLAVEIDTYMNEFDIDDNHIGIDVLSVTNSIEAVTLNNTGIDLKSGRDIAIKIDHDGYNKRLQVSASYVGGSLVSVLNHSLKMSEIVPSHVFVGFSGSTGPFPEAHQVINWAFSSISLPIDPDGHDIEKDDELKTKLVVAIPIIMGFLIVVLSVFVYIRNKPSKDNGRSRRLDADIESMSRRMPYVPKMFAYKELVKATHNFSRENLLGSGGFGSVYKGSILDPPRTIAVKKISATSKQGEREYLAEICTIGRMRHKNIVQLQGWCHEGEHLLLVYQYMSNGSLDRYIGKCFLDWNKRYKILTGLASALLYLHEECEIPVVHRDVKPNNVMLDTDYHAHLGDFGLARLLQNEASVTTMLAGTPGYLAPEVGFTGRATPESDVYSFGMVVLEVVCGRRSKGVMEENSLVDHVWSLYGRGTLIECVDGKLEQNFDKEQAERSLVAGLACLHPDATCRPKIRKVVQVFLNPNEPLMDLPESRPSTIQVSVSSSASTTTDFYSRSVTSTFVHSSPMLHDETAIHHEQEISPV